MTDTLNPPNDGWITEISHPASGLAHQMIEVGRVLFGRVVQDGREVVSPSTDPDATYRQYRGRVNRWIEEAERTASQCTCPVWQNHHDL